MNRKNLISAGFLLLLVALTVSAILKGNDMAAVIAAVKKLHPAYLCAAAATAIFFVSAEGMMICYLLRSLNYRTKAATCIKYSFVGFSFPELRLLPPEGSPCSFIICKKRAIKYQTAP